MANLEGDQYTVECIKDWSLDRYANETDNSNARDRSLGDFKWEMRFLVCWAEWEENGYEDTWEPKENLMLGCEWDPMYDEAIAEIMAQNPGKKHPDAMADEAKVKNEEEKERLRRKKLKGKEVKKEKRERSSKSGDSRASTSMDRSASGSKSGRATNNSISGQLLEPLPSVLPSKSKYIKELARDPFVPAKKIAFEPPSIFVKTEEPNSTLPAANPSYGENVDDGFADDGLADDGFADDVFAADEFADKGFADDGYADEGFADDGYADEGFADDGYADEDHAEKSSLAVRKGNDLAKEDLSRNVRADTEGFADDSDSASPKHAAAARVVEQALKGDDDEGFADEEEEEGFADDDLAGKAESPAVSLRKKQEVGNSPFADSEEEGFADDYSPRSASRSVANVATAVSRMEGSSDEGFADDDVEAMEVQKMLEVAAPVSPEDEGFADDDEIPLWKLATIKPNPPKPAPPPPKRKTRPPPPPPPKRPSFDKGRSVSASSSRSLAPRKSSTPMDLDHGFADGSASPPSSEFADDISTNSSSRGRSFKKPASVTKVVATPASNGSALGGLGSYKIPRMPKNVDVKSTGQALPPKGPRIDLPSQASPKNKSSSILPLPAPAPYRNPYYPNQQRNGHSSLPSASASVQSPPPPPTTALPPPQPAMRTAPVQAPPLPKAPAPAVATDPRRRKLNSDPHNNGFDQGSSSGIYVPLNRSVIFQKCQITDLFRRELKDDAKASRIHGDSEDTAITKLYQYWDIGNVAKIFHDFSEVMGVGTSEVRESWIYAPKKDGGGSNAKKVLADYYGLQLILSKLEGAKQTKSLEDSTRAVFVHVSEEEEIRKALAIKNPELIKLEQFRNKDVIFVLFGDKTFKQFWRKAAAVTVTPGALLENRDSFKPIFEKASSSMRQDAARDVFPYIPINYLSESGAFHAHVGPGGLDQYRQKLDVILNITELAGSDHLGIFHPCRMTPLSDTPYFPAALDSVAYRIDLIQEFTDFVAKLSIQDRPNPETVEALSVLIEEQKMKYINVRRWMIIVTAEEKEKAVNVPGIELISMAELDAFLD